MAATTTASLKRSLRIVALPLTKLPHPSTVAHKLPPQLTYYHFLTPPPPAEHTQSISKRVTAKAAQVWASLGKAEEGSWKRKAFLYGEKLVDRLEFEELALKSLDVSLGPKLLHRSPSAASSSESREDPSIIPLVYPPSFQPEPVQVLQSLLRSRTPRHKRGCITWLLIAPLTAPFMIIPIIPNFPFFFCAWRSWSHYRAFKASQYLERLLEHGIIHAEPDRELDRIYAKHMSDSASTLPGASTDLDPEASETPAEAPSSSLSSLLSPDAIPDLAAHLAVPSESTFAADLYRALEQVKLRLAPRPS